MLKFVISLKYNVLGFLTVYLDTLPHIVSIINMI